MQRSMSGRFPRWMFHVAALTVSLVLFVILSEGAVRLFIKNLPEKPLDERNLLYQYDAGLGWFPIPNSERYFSATRRIRVRNNSMGFRDHEYSQKKKPRLMFLGDSFTWGYDAEQDERFSERLQSMLPDWEILNLGVSGYGTDQEFLLLQKVTDALKPDIVFTIFCSQNDQTDNSSNSRYGYFKPYFVADGGDIHVSGIPVPKTLRYYYGRFPVLFRSRAVREFADLAERWSQSRARSVADPTVPIFQAMKKFSEVKGARFYVGLTKPLPALEESLAEAGIDVVDLETEDVYPGYGNHWTPSGHQWVAETVHAFLAARIH